MKHVYLLIFLSAFALGCNLGLDTDAFEYEPIIVVDPPVGSTEPPELVFTELMISTSSKDLFDAEKGEYIEIKNVGDGPADAANVSINVYQGDSTIPEVTISIRKPATLVEVDALNQLVPIQPDNYFVFVRHDVSAINLADTVGPHRIYDYGRFGNLNDLDQNNEAIRIELVYFDDNEGLLVFDEIRWEADVFKFGDDELPVSQDISINVDQGSESPSENDLPDAWCSSVDTISDGWQGSPGKPASCP